MNTKIKKFLKIFAISLIGVLIYDIHGLSGARISNRLASEVRRKWQKKTAQRRRMRLRKKLGKKKKRSFRSPKARGKARQRKKRKMMEKSQTLKKFSVITVTPGSSSKDGMSSSKDGMSSSKIDDKVLLNNWGIMAGADIKLVAKWSVEEVGRKALQSGNFLVTTAALQDQSQTGSDAWKFADKIFKATEQYVESHLKEAEKELNNFQSKSTTKFTEREVDWIKFLFGATVPGIGASNKKGFRYVNSQAFRNDGDGNLEVFHDYVQAVFPSWSSSLAVRENADLAIGPKDQAWKDLLARSPHLKNNIGLNMQLNAIRMLHFWKFRFAFQGNQVVLADDPTSVIHGSTHNNSRVTRFIIALRLFECKSILGLFRNLLETHFKGHGSYVYWYGAWTASDHL